MKRILFRLFMTLVFLLMLGFALKNLDSVAVRYFFGYEWQAPLVLVLLVFLAVGMAGGFMASLAIIVRQKREILELKRELRGFRAASPVTAGHYSAGS